MYGNDPLLVIHGPFKLVASNNAPCGQFKIRLPPAFCVLTTGRALMVSCATALNETALKYYGIVLLVMHSLLPCPGWSNECLLDVSGNELNGGVVAANISSQFAGTLVTDENHSTSCKKVGSLELLIVGMVINGDRHL